MRFLIALVLCLQITIISQAQNWPSFSGINASGVAEGAKPPTKWSVDQSHNVRWKTAIPGFFHASPIVWENRIFVITAISSDTNSSFVAKDRGIGLADDN